MHFFLKSIGSALAETGPGPRKMFTAAAAAIIVSYAARHMYKGYTARKQFLLQQETQKRIMEEQNAAYENQYFKEYDQLEDDPEAPVPSATCHVRETTPQGDVVMTYDAGRSMFCYYSDKRTVQFKYLESVARKYVIEHGCKRLYIDIRKEIVKAKTAATEAAKKAAAAPPAPTGQVFAQLKKYSTSTMPNKHGNNNHGNHNKLPTMNEIVKSKSHAIDSNANANNAPVLKEQVTRYVYCGRLDEFKNEQPAHETHDFNIIKPIDYESFKKINDA